jgi:hypothetical protein
LSGRKACRALAPRVIRVRSILLVFCVSLPAPSLAGANESPAPDAAHTQSIILDCNGRASEGRGPTSFASGGETGFEVNATFGEGATVALIDPETSAVLKPLYDAETTIGQLRFGAGEETTVVWTRMSGAEGALIGEAIMSDGDVLALTIDRAAQGTAQRPFVLFAATSASLIRGTCVPASHR